MIVLVSGATVAMRNHPEVGVLVVPRSRNRPALLEGRTWAMDNGAFSGLDVDAFERMLDTHHAHRQTRPLFVTAPDVVADASATMELFRQWEPRLHRLGWPVAFVGQDGLRLADVPWSCCEAVFIGGSTEWKLSPIARDLAAYAQANGKWTHMGRVNSTRRLRYAMSIGCDSVDGSKFSRWSNLYLPKIAGMIDGYQGGPLLEAL